jgi:hypothetical protein
MFSWPWPWRRGVKHGYLDRVLEKLLSLPADTSLEDKQFCLNEREMSRHANAAAKACASHACVDLSPQERPPAPYGPRRICKLARDALLQEPALLELPRFEGETVLVGDLHGQFKDLRTILAEVGRPGPRRRYIFLGDYVDRQAQKVPTSQPALSALDLAAAALGMGLESLVSGSHAVVETVSAVPVYPQGGVRTGDCDLLVCTQAALPRPGLPAARQP